MTGVQTCALPISGVFHEDGLADTVDGLGGGQDREQRLAIMKDSRIGTYGTLALILCVALKAATLSTFTLSHAALVLFAGHGAGRAAAVIAMCASPYASDPDTAKSKPAPVGVTAGECALGLVLGVWPLALLPVTQALIGAAAGCLSAGAVAFAARRLIGGYTGDVLGATEQIFEVGFLLGAAAMI